MEYKSVFLPTRTLPAAVQTFTTIRTNIPSRLFILFHVSKIYNFTAISSLSLRKWTELVQDRDKWRAFVYTAMKFRLLWYGQGNQPDSRRRTCKSAWSKQEFTLQAGGNMAHARCMLDKWGYTRVSTHMSPCTHTHNHTHPRTHTHKHTDIRNT